MMYGLTVRSNLQGRLDRIENWRSERSSSHLQAEFLSQLLGNQKGDLPPLRPLDPNRFSVETLEHACLHWLETGQWKCSIPWEVVRKELADFGDRSSESKRESLLAFSVLYPDEQQLQGVRSKLMGLMPPILDQLGHGEMLFLTGEDPLLLLERCPDVRIGWIYALCTVCVDDRVAPLLALTIRHCERQGLDLIEWVRTGIREIDADLMGSGTNLRIGTGVIGCGVEARDYQMFAARKDLPGMDAIVKVNGNGGPLRAGLPALLRETLYELPPVLMHILEGDEPIKRVKRARSKADFLELLGREDSLVRIKLELSGDVSIDDDALEPYRMRLQTLMECVRTRFPNVKANGDIVAVAAK